MGRDLSQSARALHKHGVRISQCIFYSKKATKLSLFVVCLLFFFVFFILCLFVCFNPQIRTYIVYHRPFKKKHLCVHDDSHIGSPFEPLGVNQLSGSH